MVYIYVQTLILSNYIAIPLFFFVVSSLTVTIDPNNITAKIFESVTFVCTATGSGDFLFTWEHDGSVILTSNSTVQQDSLSIDSILPQHQGQYKCTVTASYSSLVMSSDAFVMLNLNGNFYLAFIALIRTLYI